MAKKKEQPQNRNNNGRDDKGRFVSGSCGNPGGRPKIPDEIKEYGKQAPERLRAIADDPKTPVKIRADIEKWFAEMTFGKATQQQIVDATIEQTEPMTITFKGKLAEWSE